MQILIRADASSTIGAGHVMRCLALANGLREKGAAVQFACRPSNGDLIGLLEQRQFRVLRLIGVAPSDEMQDADELLAALPASHLHDVLIVDHYALGIRWERRAASIARRLMAIDDLLDRPHAADILLDQNLAVPGHLRAPEATPAACRILQGPLYALLRPEFLAVRTSLKKRDGVLRNVLIYYGGADPENETSRTLKALGAISDRTFSIDVVVGSANPHQTTVELLCKKMQDVRYFCGIDTMAIVMAGTDICFGAAGSSSWERCCVGQPAFLTVLAENQQLIAQALHTAGAAINLGTHVSSETYRAAPTMLTPARIVEMQERCLSLVDGRGVNRVCDILMEMG